MVRADLYIFGYKKVRFEPEFAPKIATLLLKKGVCAQLNRDCFYIRASDYKRLENELSVLTVGVGDTEGLPAAFKRLLYSRGLLSAILILAVIFSLTSGLVWEVRVRSDGSLPAAAVAEELRALGFGVGARWSAHDISELETALLSGSETVGWISINRLGSVAEVEVIGKTSVELPEPQSGYANIVATCDAVIEEITVKSGVAAVSVGDAVSAGDLLISGVLPSELGGGFCRAEGVVRGRFSRTLSVTVDKNEELRSPRGREISEISLQIFNFSVNIFKKYGNVGASCVIIKEIEDLIVANGTVLPVSLVKTYAEKYETATADYTNDELVRIAHARLSALTARELYSSDVLSVKTEGGFTDSGYAVSSLFTVVTDIGKSVLIEYGEK